MTENKEKMEKRNRLKKFLAVLRRRRTNTKSPEEMYFDMGPYSGNETPNKYMDKGIQATPLNGSQDAEGDPDELRTSNV